MNAGHDKLASWGLTHMEINPDATVLDIGCGGGRNISNLLKKASGGKVFGVDYSSESIKKSIQLNQEAVAQKKAEVIQASVSSLPFPDKTFDAATAFETIYFWPDLVHDFMEVQRILKPGGLFLICNEASKPKDFEKWSKWIDLRVYTQKELSDTLAQAGFEQILCHAHPNGRWLCITARAKSNPA